jgi:hypothetical protein
MASYGLSTLHHVTERKLSKLDHHREQFEADRKAILANVASARDPLRQVEALLEGFERYAITPADTDLSIANLERFVHQAKHDSSVSPALLRDWKSKLEHELDVASVKYEYAALFGKLVIDWIKNPNDVTTSPGGSFVSEDSNAETITGFERVGRKEMHQQRKLWESFVFAENSADQSKIEAYLDDIFETTLQSKKVKKSPLENLRDSMKQVMDFKSDLQTPKQKDDPLNDPPVVRFTVEKLKACIRGVLHSNLLAGRKREGLVALQDQPAVLTELVDVLNMDLDALDQWKWDPAPVPLAMRRELNGKYRVYMDAEVHQTILLHFIGKTWAVALKEAFTTFQNSGAWLQTSYRSMDRKARERRDHFLPDSASASTSIRDARLKDYQTTYFMTQLPDNDLDNRAYEPENANGAQNGAPVVSFATKQTLLRLVTTEMLLNTKVYGEFLVLQSDFRWFGPSLPHATVFAVLKFLGVPEKWLHFFKTFLEAPVVFVQDGPGAQARTRTCGVPMSLVLSDALSEAVLFCLDLAVNKRTQGANLYRFHDDLWFWGQESTCVQGWNALREFSSVMGLSLNEDKTGAALVVANQAEARPLPSTLPQKDIKWGFLKLDSADGRWIVDQAKVDEHIEELRRQLGACRSVMAWIQAWNTYLDRFFCTNLGEPANCFARQHNDLIISTFERIQQRLFAESGTANVTDHLRGMLKERFGTADSVPDGFFYFPEQFGGLGLRNPLVTAFATYKLSPRTPGEAIDHAFDEEQEAYERFKEAFESGEHKYGFRGMRDIPPFSPNEPFMSFEEFTRYREEVSAPLVEAYTTLLQAPRDVQIDTSFELGCALLECKLDTSPEQSLYWTWICNLYQGDIKKRFGGDGMQLGDRSSLPVGLLDVLKSEKVRWEG